MENVILNGKDISHLITSFEIYEEMNKEHIIGNAISTQIKLKLKNKDNQLTDQLGYPFIIGNKSYLIYDKPEKWTGSVSLTLYDKMILTNKPYKTSLVYPTTVSQQLDEMISLTGVVIDKSTLSNDVLNKVVNWYDTSMLIRNYLGFISQCDGKNALIENDSIVFKPIASKTHNISFSSGYELNELITFSRVCFDDGLVLLSKGSNTGKTLYVSKENSYISQKDIDRIYTMYNGLSFYSFKKMNCKGIDGLILTDLISYHDITVLPFSIKRIVNGGKAKDSIEISGDMSIANADTVIIKEDTNLKIRRLQTVVDQNNAKLEIIAQDVDDQEEQISKLVVTSDEIKTKVEKVDEIESRMYSTCIIESSLGYTFSENDTAITTLTARMYIDEQEHDAEGKLLYRWFYEDGTPIGANKSIEVEVSSLGNHSVYFVACENDEELTAILGQGVLGLMILGQEGR